MDITWSLYDHASSCSKYMCGECISEPFQMIFYGKWLICWWMEES